MLKMSLVEYDSSSSDGSEECEDSYEHSEVMPSKGKFIMKEDLAKEHASTKNCSLLLPMPKKEVETQQVSPCTDIKLALSKLPPVKIAKMENKQIVELDDEFLHRKDKLLHNSPMVKPTHNPSTKCPNPVKIMIPSIKDFDDVNGELASKAKCKQQSLANLSKRSGLLSILPKPKSELGFTKSLPHKAITSPEVSRPIAPAFIPDTVARARPASNTENIDGRNVRSLQTSMKASKSCSDNEASDEEATNENSITDFFSLERNEKLPKVCTNEINAMVAKRAAEIVESANKHCRREISTAKEPKEEQGELELEHASVNKEKLDAMEAIKALAGSSIKRKRYELEDIQMTDLTSEQVLPNRDEWMRTALASSTTYQSTGVLVDEEPASGTRRKHQITYLAHKAKANEAELQAMWAANRQTRRATQNKYGF
uniref:Proline-rich protein PRCC n=1 Tax=Glossina palpalis gambiensis TaxID=67801 RepID=A0A1B0B996_9MUSC